MKDYSLEEKLMAKAVKEIKSAFGTPAEFTKFTAVCFFAMDIFEKYHDAITDSQKSLRNNTRPIFADLLFTISSEWDKEDSFRTSLSCIGIDHGTEEFYQQICYAYATYMYWESEVDVQEYDKVLHGRFKALLNTANYMADYRIDLKKQDDSN